MTINAQDFLDSIKSIPDDVSSLEVDLRNAISRAYYCAYHACKPNFDVTHHENCGSHEDLIESMIDTNIEPVKKIALQLRKCKIKRVKADYHLNQNVFVGEAQQVIKEAQKISDGIEQLINSGSLLASNQAL